MPLSNNMCSALVCRVLAVAFSLSAMTQTSGADGLTENVALHKKCNMSSFHADTHGSCERAVNGDTDGQFLGKDNCIHTAVGDMDPWLEVDLGRPYPILSIVLLARSKYEHRMANSRITVDGEECFVFPQNTEHMDRKVVINCTWALTGQVVRISKEVRGKAEGDQTLNVCELQVLSCVEEAWGRGCDEQCGQCAEEEEEGCDKVTGHCDHCAPGMKPPFCLLPSAVYPDSEMSSSSDRLTKMTDIAFGALAAAVTLAALP